MKAVFITRHGGPSVLRVREAPDPHPGHGEVRVRVRAAGLNFSDLVARQGLYPEAPRPPCVMGYEISGVVDALGPGAGANGGGIAAGTRVLALTRFGGQAAAVCVPVEHVRVLPDAMSFEEAAAMPVVYLTAHHVLFRVGALREGASLLVHNAGGGVGLAALQLARTVPRVRIFGTASGAKHELLRANGCDYPIDYHKSDYAKVIKEQTRGRGVDLVLDPLGGADWRKGYDLLAPAGMLIAFGFANISSGATRNLWNVAKNLLAIPRFSPMSLMQNNRAVAGVNLAGLWDDLDLLTPQMDALLSHYEAGRIRPVIDSIFPFERAGSAHARLHERKNVGKVLLVPEA